LHARCLLVEFQGRLVTVAQLAEHRVVVPKVAGSSPVGHPPVGGRDLREGDLRKLPHL
jgi:hypothetical protein